MRRLRARAKEARQRAFTAAVENSFDRLSRAGRMVPMARPGYHRVECIRNLAYDDSGLPHHRLDVYRPEGPGPFPSVFYIHGGGFRSLSKDTHWIMGLIFARRGYVVFNVDYRLAPKHPYPAALSDVCSAWKWFLHEGPRWGADLDRILVSGESAGANLATALTLATCFERPEPFARDVFELGRRPAAVAPMCGILQVSDPERFRRRLGRRVPDFLFDPARIVSQDYLAGFEEGTDDFGLADPLLILESELEPLFDIPPTFSGVGLWDPIAEDTRRLQRALERRGTRSEVRFYERETHAFHALVFRRRARECWRDLFRFLGDLGLHETIDRTG